MDEIRLFEQLQPPPPPDSPRMRAAARARLTAATSTPPAHPAARRSTVVSVATAAALVAAAGTGYGLAAAHSGISHRPGDSSPQTSTSARQRTAAELTAVHGCRGEYITAGTLKQVTGTQLVIQPANDHDHVNRVWRAQPVTVATTGSTAITRPASGTVSDITDGSIVDVQGTWSDGKLAATEIGIEANLPPAGSFGPNFPRHLGKLRSRSKTGHLTKAFPPSKANLGFPFADGTVKDVHDGSFTVVTRNLMGVQRIRVTTSDSTKVLNKAGVSLSQLTIGSNVVAVGRIGSGGVMAASTVAEQAGMKTLLAGGPVKIRPSGCSAAAITTAVVLAGG